MSGSQEQTNRRILQSLQERREKLRVQEQQQSSKRAVGSGPPMRSSGSRPSSRTVTSKPPDPSTALREQSEAQHMLLQQRAALQHAHSQSYGYYVTQDSQFGNLILPVLPRFEEPSK